MKAFVHDKQNDGAEVYFSESREKAVEYFRQEEIAQLKYNIERYKESDFNKYDKDFIELRIKHQEENINYTNSERFGIDCIKEYEVAEGKGFWTEGSY